MKATTLGRLRRLHLYVAVFFAPAIVFFGFSGIVQTFGLHETRGTPAWVEAMASLHQHQRLPRPEPATGAAPAADHEADHDGDHDGDHAPPPGGYTVGMVGLKLFTGLTGLGLVIASLLGIAVALGTPSTRRVSAAMLIVGLVLPVAFILG